MIVFVIMAISLMVFVGGATLHAKSERCSTSDDVGAVLMVLSGLVLVFSFLFSVLSEVYHESTFYEAKTITKTVDGITMVSYSVDGELRTLTSNLAPIYVAPDTNLVVKYVVNKNSWHGDMSKKLSIEQLQ